MWAPADVQADGLQQRCRFMHLQLRVYTLILLCPHASMLSVDPPNFRILQAAAHRRSKHLAPVLLLLHLESECVLMWAKNDTAEVLSGHVYPT